LLEDYQETACLSQETYTQICSALARETTSNLSVRIQTWLNIHHVASGADQMNVLLVPRESALSLEQDEANAARRQFVADLLDGNKDEESLQVHRYDRLPVLNQIYDILTYTHRAHANPAEMVAEIGRMRFAFVTWTMAEIFVRLCPLCNLRGKSSRFHDDKTAVVAS